ncbi:hypothetical protein AB0O64_30495 [Streptomyces sp. NPDC088341]
MTVLPTRGTAEGGDDEEQDKLPGQPWKPILEPHPDGGSPEGDGKHRK